MTVTEMELVIRKVTVTDRDSDGDIVGHDYSERDSDSNRERDRESDNDRGSDNDIECNRDSNTYGDRDGDSDGDSASVSAVTISLGKKAHLLRQHKPTSYMFKRPQK